MQQRNAKEHRRRVEPTWEEVIEDLAASIGRLRAFDRRRRDAPSATQYASPWFAELLEHIYPQPGGMEHESDYLRLMAADLPGMDRAHVADERARLRLRLMLDPEPSPWLVARLELIEEARRGAG